MHIKSQSAIEFIVLVSFMLIVIIGLFAVTSSRTSESQEEGNRKIAEDIASLAYKEIEIAKSANDGYTRIFAMPGTVSGVLYEIKIIDKIELIVNYLDYEHVRFLPANVTGNISIGLNQIKKIDGVIYFVEIESQFVMRNEAFNVILFKNNGNVVLKGTLTEETNPVSTLDDEFIFKDIGGNIVALINLNTGNMFITGKLFERQFLDPSPSSNDFVVKNPFGNVISYLDESGNFYVKGTLTQNGNP